MQKIKEVILLLSLIILSGCCTPCFNPINKSYQQVSPCYYSDLVIVYTFCVDEGALIYVGQTGCIPRDSIQIVRQIELQKMLDSLR